MAVYANRIIFSMWLSVCLLAMPAMALAADGFAYAKKILENQVCADHRITIYCGASYDAAKNIVLPPGFSTSVHKDRSTRMEWEHAVPAENFGRAFVEWREGSPQCIKNGKPYRGRKCAEKASDEFRRMEMDMYNLFPSIGAVNAARSNRQYSELPGVAPSFGSCQAKISGNRFEPPDRSKGAVARAALYMDSQYPHYNLSRQQKRLFNAWDRKFPPDQWECTRTRRIEKIQGNPNRFVRDQCRQKGMW